MSKKILIATVHRPDRSPSQRFRFEQYLSYLKDNGFLYDFSFLISGQDDRVFYGKGRWFGKMLILAKSILKRLRDNARLSKYDIIFVQREAFMLGSIFFEKRFHRSKAKFIFDFDDSIWLRNVSKHNKALSFLKNPNKIAKLIKMADLVLAGNQYLANYALQFNQNVQIVPTTIDTDNYRPQHKKRPDKICIGWSGSTTTIEHFRIIVPVLYQLKGQYGELIFFKVIGDSSYKNESLLIEGRAWTKADELKELNSFDIGIMPLPDDEWSKGKCGLKGLQYMALEIPTVMSNVGVNAEIIRHGENGYLARTEKEWIDCLSLLIENEELRQAIGKAGRKTVVDKYSANIWKNTYLKLFNSI